MDQIRVCVLVFLFVLAWPQFQQDAMHTGSTTASGDMSGARELWNYSSEAERLDFSGPGHEFSSPVVGDVDGDDRVEVVVAIDGGVLCLDGRLGVREWVYPVNASIWTTPAIHDNMIVVGADDGRVYCLNGSTGEQVWHRDLKSPVRAPPAISNNTIVVGTLSGELYALDCSGNTLWNASVGADIYAAPLIANLTGDDRAEVVVGALDGGVHAYHRDGEHLWTFKTYDYVFSAPSAGDLDDDGKPEVVVGSDDFHVYVLNGSDGSQKARFKTRFRVPTSPTVCDIDGDGGLEVVVCSGDRCLYALDHEDGNLSRRWRVEFAEVAAPPASADLNENAGMEVVVGTRDGFVYAVKDDGRGNGSVLWSRYLGRGVWAAPAIANVNGDGRAEIIVNADGQIYALGGEKDAVGQSSTVSGDVGWVERVSRRVARLSTWDFLVIAGSLAVVVLIQVRVRRG